MNEEPGKTISENRNKKTNNAKRTLDNHSSSCSPPTPHPLRTLHWLSMKAATHSRPKLLELATWHDCHKFECHQSDKLRQGSMHTCGASGIACPSSISVTVIVAAVAIVAGSDGNLCSITGAENTCNTEIWFHSWSEAGQFPSALAEQVPSDTSDVGLAGNGRRSSGRQAAGNAVNFPATPPYIVLYLQHEGHPSPPSLNCFPG